MLLLNFFMTLGIIALNVTFHHFGLSLIARHLYSRDTDSTRILLTMLGLTIIHVLEITVYAGIYKLLVFTDFGGSLTQGFEGTMLDCFYYSASVYTTVGLATYAPEGGMKLLSVMEALNGFMLITWSAAFLYRGAATYWDRGGK